VLRFHDLRFYEPSTILLKISILTTLPTTHIPPPQFQTSPTPRANLIQMPQ